MSGGAIVVIDKTKASGLMFCWLLRVAPLFNHF